MLLRNWHVISYNIEKGGAGGIDLSGNCCSVSCKAYCPHNFCQDCSFRDFSLRSTLVNFAYFRHFLSYPARRRTSFVIDGVYFSLYCVFIATNSTFYREKALFSQKRFLFVLSSDLSIFVTKFTINQINLHKLT